MNSYLLEEWPVSKSLRAIPHNYDWNSYKKWYLVSDNHESLEYIDYAKIRKYETLTLSSNVGVKIMFSMKVLIDTGKRVIDYYNLAELGNCNLFVRLINTYYSLERAQELIKQIPDCVNDSA